MAIQTQGFGVRQMPVYTAPNPSLVAFNPAIAADGMMQAFQLAKELENIKAKRALQAELEATRQSRIAQQNALSNLDVGRAGMEGSLLPDLEAAKRAQYQATGMTAIPEAEFSLAKISAQKPLFQPEADLRMGQISNSKTLLPQELAAKQAELAFSTERARTMMPTLALEADYRTKNMNADLRALEPLTDAKIQDATLKTKKSKIDEGYVEEDAKASRGARDMDTLLKGSQVAENYARANYYGKGGATKATNYAAQIQAASAEKDRLLDTKFLMPDGKTVGNLLTYRQLVYPEGGENVSGKTGLIFKDPMVKNQMAEDMLKQYQLQNETIARLTALRNAALLEEGGQPSGGSKDQSQISPQDEAALKWAQDPKNAKSPHLKGVVEKLRSKGIIQ
jgi:hypothetical protein